MENKAWQRLVDFTIFFTAIVTVALLGFALYINNERQQQLLEVLRTTREIADSNFTNIEEHRESTLQHHCSTAYLIAKSGGISDEEMVLVDRACSNTVAPRHHSRS